MNQNLRLSRGYIATLVLAIAAVVVVFVWSPHPKHYWSGEGVIWTTDYHVTCETTSRLDDSIVAVFNRVDNCASTFNPNSMISRINQNKTDSLNDMLIGLLRTSQQVHKASGGLFDPTVMPLVNAWGFGYKSGEMPTTAMIDSIRQFVGLSKCTIQDHRLVKADPRLQFDFSSIAKGMAVDEVARMIERNGGENYMVEVGGEVVVKGHNAKGKPWHISIDMPIAEEQGKVQHQSALVLSLDQGAVATSGNYRKFKEVKGKKVSHIINPLSGYSSESNLLSVTIVAPNCQLADAWATACMVMGLNRTQSMMQSRADLGVMTISANEQGDFVVWSNKAFASHVAK